ncbi:MAG: alpha/beta hydrolase [Alphaproteobacteria bacterium]
MAMIRALKALFALLLARLPEPAAALWFAGRRRVYEGRRIEARAQAIGEMGLAARDPSARLTPETMRKAYRDGRKVLDTPGPAMVLRQDAGIPGPAGDIPVRVYDAEDNALMSTAQRPTLVYLHGGGWVIGDLDTHEGACARLAAASGARVLAVEYRKAPDHPFPAAPDDVLAVHDWIEAKGATFGIDPRRLAYAGDSAGGNLTAVLMHDLAAAGRSLPKAQILIYPATDLNMTGPIFEDLANAYVLPPALCTWFRDQYLPAGARQDDPRVSPMMSPHLGQQPPAFIITAGHDVLRPQGEAYAEALKAAGVAVTYEEAEGLVHGFINFNAALPTSEAALRRMGEWLKARL